MMGSYQLLCGSSMAGDHRQAARSDTWHHTPACQVSDKISPEDLTTMIGAFNPDNLPGRLAVVVRMGAAKLRQHLPTLIRAVEASGQVSKHTPRAHAGLQQDTSGVRCRCPGC